MAPSEKSYQKYREIAKKIIEKTPQPLFYPACEQELADSRIFFHEDPAVQRIQTITVSFLKDNLGHTMAHSQKVALEAGALVLRETEYSINDGDRATRLLRLAHCSGLLHDIARKEKNHAEKGAIQAEKILKEENFPEKDIQTICEAIRRHEAFTEHAEAMTPEEKLISDCLYDSDKFRWGPDNFAHTIWDMLEAASIPVEAFLSHYKTGVIGIEKIRKTFRSESGKLFGPEFIDIGMEISEILYEEMVLIAQKSEEKE